jgi:5-methylthioadenosine/S-adenosylhomocysteine deaminase
MTFLRSRADDMPLQSWLTTQVFPFEAKLTEDDVYWFSKLAILDYLRGGTVCAVDMYLNNSAVAQAAIDMQFRISMVGSLNDFGGTVEEMEEDILRFNIEHHGSSEFVKFFPGVHAEYTTSPEKIAEVAALAKKYQMPTFTHLAETKTEVTECLERTDKTPVQHLLDCGFWAYGGAGFHCVHLSADDIRLMKENDIAAVCCPGSNLKLASGVADLSALEAAGVKIALGTDGPASNNALSMFREMYLACVLQKVKHDDAAAMNPELAFEYATRNGSDLAGVVQDVDQDFFEVDASLPALQLHSVKKNLVYASDTSVVKSTTVGGVKRYENGEFHLPNGERVERIYKECKTRAARIFD